MLMLTSPLDAYREDVAKDPGRTEFTADDGALLAFVVLLHRHTQLRADSGAPLTRVSQEIERAATDLTARLVPERNRLTPEVGFQLLPLARAIAVVAEDAGALRLANVMLHLATLVVGKKIDRVELGRVTVLRARIARKAQAHEQSRALYEEALTIGAETGNDELVARAHVGFSMLSRSRGNVPETREHLLVAKSAAERSGNAEALSMAHHGLMLIAASFKQFDEAMVYAWSAFRDVEGDAEREAEALLNVGQVIFDSGRPKVALRVFTAALTRKPPRRLALPALGGAARSASLLGNEPLVRRFVRDIDEQTRSADLRHVALDALREAVEALAPFAPALAERRRRVAHDEAVRSKFHEVAFLLEQLASARPAPPLPAVAATTERDDVVRVLREANLLEVGAEYAAP